MILYNYINGEILLRIGVSMLNSILLKPIYNIKILYGGHQHNLC